MKKNSMPYKITIDGEAYTLMSDEPESHVQKVGSLVDAAIKDLRVKNPHMASSKLAILATIQCASQMLHAQQEAEKCRAQGALLVEYIDKELL